MPVPWVQWIELPVRAFDLSVNTPRRQIRVPTVIIATHYDRMPMAQPRLTRRAIFQRDAVCANTPANRSAGTRATSTTSCPVTVAAAILSRISFGPVAR